MFILLIRALTLDGAMDGLAYYVKVDWDKLLVGKTWIDGATQIFFAYSVGMGALPALGSYNKFHHDCFKDAIITCVVNTLTCLLAGVLVFSILGYMAHVQETTIDDVVNSGPGLVFLTYPDLVLKLPFSVLWAFIFFCMLLVISNRVFSIFFYKSVFLCASLSFTTRIQNLCFCYNQVLSHKTIENPFLNQRLWFLDTILHFNRNQGFENQ